MRIAVVEGPSMHNRVPKNVSEADDALDLALLEPAPSGAFVLAGIAVALLVVAWLVMYFFLFIPRGPVGNGNGRRCGRAAGGHSLCLARDAYDAARRG